MADHYFIRPMELSDLKEVAEVHRCSFPRQMESEAWISCNFRAYPRIRIFVADSQGKIAGYIQWTEKAGFRKEVVLEIEHLAVLPEERRLGVASALIQRSLPSIREQLAERGAAVKSVLVTTGVNNAIAQELYRKTLNASAEATIRQLFSADELIMLARDLL